MIKRVAFVFNVLIVVVFSFPSQTIVEYNTKLPKSSDQLSTENIDEPLIVIVEEKDSKSSGSVIVQFVYNGNTMDKRDGMKNERYNIAQNSRDQPQINYNSNITEEKMSTSVIASNKTENITLKKEIISKAEAGKKKLEQEKLFFSKKTEWIPKLYNTASMTEKEKYFSEVSGVIPAFPELMHGKGERESSIGANAQPKTFLVDSKYYERPKYSEPILYPKTVYNTEFDVPFV